jgi:hypothetical protein
MPTTDWKFKYDNTTDFTNSVLSASITQGRQKYLDSYSGGSISITINNNANLAANFTFNTKILVYNNLATADYYDLFVVQEITFDDYPGNVGLSTATILAVDALGRAGRIQATNKNLTQANTLNQLDQFNYTTLPSDIVFSTSFGGGESIASAQTYTGTVLNQINNINATERGIFTTSALGSFTTQRIYAFERVNPYMTLGSYSFGRNTSSSVIAYNSFKRYQNGLSFINTATISPLGLSSETRTNSSSITTFGPTFYSASTVDYNATQAQGNGDWIVNSFSDPASLRFELEFTDRSQNSVAYDLFSSFFFAPDELLYAVAYREPGAGSDTTVNLVREGWQINITPSETSYRLFFSPLTYYQFFTLNSSTLGILDTSRLGW